MFRDVWLRDLHLMQGLGEVYICLGSLCGSEGFDNMGILILRYMRVAGGLVGDNVCIILVVLSRVHSVL